MHDFNWKRFLYIVVYPALIYCAIAVYTDAGRLNPTAILVLISLSVGVCVAFIPNVCRVFRKGEILDVEGVICLGVMATWISNIVRPGTLLLTELFPSLSWLRDTDLVSAGLAICIYGGVMHLAAPALDKGRMPAGRWAYIGSLAAFGVFVALVALNWGDVSAMWRGQTDSLHPAVFRGPPPHWMPRQKL